MYVVLSVLLSTAVVSHAAFQKRFFYRTMVYLSDSKVAIMAAGNLALVSVILVWKLVQAIFLGRLRFREIERLNVRARDAIIECCFATTIFRDEVNLSFLALVTTLLMVKSLHWLAKDRMDFLEEQPLSPRVAHVRLLGLMGLLFAMDVYMVAECAKVTYRLKVGTMLVLFAFEFTVLLIELCSDFVRYVFHAIDLRMDGRWESKGMYVFYNELVTDLCQLTVYLAFFLYVHIYYTFPLHILREVYLTFSKFQRRCSDFIRYRRVMSTMNDRFPDATEEELAAGDRTCIICREEMPTAKKLPCGHMFHAHCLQSWLRRQLSCPTCRSPVDVATPVTSRGGDANGPVEGPAIADGAGENGAPQAEHAPENPGFMANAQRLWRHIAYGAPREGAPPPAANANAPAPAQAEPPQAPRRRRAGGRGRHEHQRPHRRRARSVAGRSSERRGAPSASGTGGRTACPATAAASTAIRHARPHLPADATRAAAGAAPRRAAGARPRPAAGRRRGVHALPVDGAAGRRGASAGARARRDGRRARLSGGQPAESSTEHGAGARRDAGGDRPHTRAGGRAPRADGGRRAGGGGRGGGQGVRGGRGRWGGGVGARTERGSVCGGGVVVDDNPSRRIVACNSVSFSRSLHKLRGRRHDGVRHRALARAGGGPPAPVALP